MGGARDDEQFDFQVAARSLEAHAEMLPPERPSKLQVIGRAGRASRRPAAWLAILGLVIVNVSLMSEAPVDADNRTSGRTSDMTSRESLADAPGPDASGLRERFMSLEKSPPKSKAPGENSRRKRSVGHQQGTSFVAWAALSDTVQNDAPTAASSAASSSSSTKEGGNKKAPTEPEPLPEPDAVMYRMYNSQTNDHYFTTNAEEKDRLLNEGYRNYMTEGIIFSRQEKGTYPIHTDDGIVGYAFGKQHDGTVPLHFLRGPNGEGDLFTTDIETKDRWHLREGWDYLGIAGYIGRWGPP